MKIFITGANGLLGQKLLRIFNINQPNFEIFALSKGPNKIKYNGTFTYIDIDITNKQSVEELVIQYNPEFVINCAAITNVDRCQLQRNLSWNVNVEAVKNFTDVCALTNTFLIQVSTDFIFDGKNGPYDEEAECKPVNFYGATKFESEKYLIKSNIRYTIIRTNQVYGYVHGLKRPNIVTWVKNSLEVDRPIQALTDQFRTPAFADDLAMGCYLATIRYAQGIYNIGSRELVSVYEFACIVADVCKLDKELISPISSSSFKQIATRPLKTGLIITKAIKNLGYNPNSIKQGIELMINQMKQH